MRRVAKANSTTVSGETRLMATPIREDGATVRESMPAVLQSTGSSLLALRMVPERALKTMMTRLAATASFISHPPAYTSPGTHTLPPPPPRSPAQPPPAATPAPPHEDDPAPDPDKPGENPAHDADDAQEHQLQEIHHPILAEAGGYFGTTPPSARRSRSSSRLSERTPPTTPMTLKSTSCKRSTTPF